jgi:hypothetical protein
MLHCISYANGLLVRPQVLEEEIGGASECMPHFSELASAFYRFCSQPIRNRKGCCPIISLLLFCEMKKSLRLAFTFR